MKWCWSCFTLTQGQTPCIDLPDPEVYPEDMLLGRLHFAEISPTQTLLRIFIGWTDSAPLEGQSQLYDVLDRYMDLLHRVLQPNDPPVTPVQDEPPVMAKPEDEAQQEWLLPEPVVVAAEALTIGTVAEEAVANDASTEDAKTEIRGIDSTAEECACAEANCVGAGQSLPPTAEAVEDNPPAAWQVQAIEGTDRLHQAKPLAPWMKQRLRWMKLRPRILPTRRTQSDSSCWTHQTPPRMNDSFTAR